MLFLRLRFETYVTTRKRNYCSSRGYLSIVLWHICRVNTPVYASLLIMCNRRNSRNERRLNKLGFFLGFPNQEIEQVGGERFPGMQFDSVYCKLKDVAPMSLLPFLSQAACFPRWFTHAVLDCRNGDSTWIERFLIMISGGLSRFLSLQFWYTGDGLMVDGCH